MTLTDYLINAIFVVVVLRQARERRLDLRSFVAPMAMVVFVATHYVRSIPTGGRDLGLAAALTAVGLTLGVASGLVTHVRADADGTRYARVGWLAGLLLVAGISSRMVFVFALEHGAGQAVRDFSIVHHISAAAARFGLDGLVRGDHAAGAGPAEGPPPGRPRAGSHDGRPAGMRAAVRPRSGSPRRAGRGSMLGGARGRWLLSRRDGDA